MNEKEKKQILAMWEEGMSINAIVRLLPYKQYVAREKIKQLRESGYLQGDVHRKRAKTIERILTAYNEGNMCVKELSKMCGVSMTTIRKALANNGIRIKRAKTRQKGIIHKKLCKRTADIVNALKNGKTMSQTANEFNVSKQYVHQVKTKILKRYLDE